MPGAEHQIAKALSKMIEQATNQDLNKGLRSHLDETRHAAVLKATTRSGLLNCPLPDRLSPT
jgi:ferritin-like metal-binding protein YciE